MTKKVDIIVVKGRWYVDGYLSDAHPPWADLAMVDGALYWADDYGHVIADKPAQMTGGVMDYGCGVTFAPDAA